VGDQDQHVHHLVDVRVSPRKVAGEAAARIAKRRRRVVADPKRQAEEVRVGGQDLERGPELLSKLVLVVGRCQRLPPPPPKLVAKLIEQVVRQGPQQVVAIPEVLPSRDTRGLFRFWMWRARLRRTTGPADSS
jgi:hypothetical protein